jgi:starch phosphorylase
MIERLSHRPLPEALGGLDELALDLRWSGSQASDRVWELLDAEAWERTRNPYLILQNVSDSRLAEAANDPSIIAALTAGLEDRRKKMDSPGWFSKRYGDGPLKSVAYFCMEFGLSEALPIYSGGLGLLAGDHLKTASDLGVPVTGIGILYQQGYFRQIIGADGWQIEALPYNDPTSLPVLPVRDPKNGGWLRVKVRLPGRTLRLRVWRAQVGVVNLYLLDSNDPLNSPWDRAITSALYSSGQSKRLIQEIVLGVGGWRVIEELGIDPDVCHLNEGHAAFVVLARARTFMEKHGVSFQQGLWATRPGNVFTTHTPVAAGFDRFDPNIARQYAQQLSQLIEVPAEELMGLGRQNPEDEGEFLNMAYLAMRGSGYINAVSELHGRVSRHLFTGLYPRWPVDEVPVTHVTNGVHVPSWDSQDAHNLWGRVCGSDSWLDDERQTPLSEAKLSDEELWSFRCRSRRQVVEYVRRRLERQLLTLGAEHELIERSQNVLDPNALTLGFARRFATYKRPNLLLHNVERLKRILLSTDRPVQLIVAGKAHPADEPGKMLVQEMARFAMQPEMIDRMVFLADYDMALTQQLVAGVDVWINTPRRPWEASGTSGMKVLVNGGLNLSELDGWWAEAYDPEIGWALGDGEEHNGADLIEWDAVEARQLYSLLEERIVPEFYDCDHSGVPHAWVHRVRESMCRLTYRFSSHRMLHEYVENLYLPAASAYRRRAENGGKRAVELEEWHERLERGWKGLRFGQVNVAEEKDGWRFEIHVFLPDIEPEDVAVELYANPVPNEPSVFRLERGEHLTGSINGYIYSALIQSSRCPDQFTPRIVPHHADALVPQEAMMVTWQR